MILQAMCYNGSDAQLQALFQDCISAENEFGPFSSPNPKYAAKGRIPDQLYFSFLLGAGVIGAVAEDFDVPWEFIPFDHYVALQWLVRAFLGPSNKFFAQSVQEKLQNSGRIFVVTGSEGSASSVAAYSMVASLNQSSLTWTHIFGGYSESRQQVVDRLVTVEGEGTAWAVLQVDELSSNTFQVEISMNQSNTPSVQSVLDRFSGGLSNTGYRDYMMGGFIAIQQLIQEYYVSQVVGVASPPVNALAVVPMPFGTYRESQFLRTAGNISPLVLVLAFLYTVSQLAKRIVEEKESRLREGMMIMGLGKAAFFSSWIFMYVFKVLITTTVITIVLKQGILTQSEPTIIFVLYFLFGCSTVSLSTLFSSFFSKSRLTAMVVPILYFLTAIPSFALPDGTSRGTYLLLSLFSPTAFSLGTKLLFTYEINNGLGWNAVNSPLDEVNMAAVMFMLVFDSVVYLLITFYLDEVLPSEWGTKQHPLFCCCCCCAKANYADGDDLVSTAGDTEMVKADARSPRSRMAPGKGNPSAVEDYPQGRQASVLLRKLRKEFSTDQGTKKIAVDGFDLRLFEGDITVILGHNGAGKTTTLNMLTGMIPIDRGDCLVYGASVRTDVRAARGQIGFCPQHNILWDDLTCIEHLQYIARLKGKSGDDIDRSAVEMLKRVDLSDKRDVFSKNLSGGQKRKLSVAMAFIGGSRLILLDEPTAGMDAAARRHTWDLLKEMSVGRTIVLTTHFMDEADLLGNRIAIMSKGALHSYGTSMFLKSRLGSGYALRLSLTRAVSNEAAMEMVAIARAVITSASLKEHKGQEVAIELPMSDQRLFPAVIQRFEEAEIADRFWISGISMSVASLEDVFVRIAYDEELLGNAEIEDPVEVNAANGYGAMTSTDNTANLLGTPMNQVAEADPLISSPAPSPHHQHGSAETTEAMDTLFRLVGQSTSHESPFLLQLQGLLWKRLHNSRRDRRTICLQVFLPLVSIVLAMLLAMLKAPDPSLLWIDASMYNNANQAICFTNCPSFFDGANTTSSFPGESMTPYQLSSFPQVVGNQSRRFSDGLMSDYFLHGNTDRNMAFSCGDTSLTSNGLPATVIFTNASAYHGLPEAISEWMGTAARSQTQNSNLKMRIGNFPLPLTNRQTGTINSFQTIIIGFFILIPFTFIPSTFVSWVVKERQCKAKHLQFVSGVNYFAYWTSNYLFDLTSFVVTEILAITVFFIFGRDEYVGSDSLGATFVLFLLYGLSAIAAAYTVSFFFENHSSAQTIVMLGNFLCGFVLVITMFILKQLSSTKDVAKILVFVFRVVPAYCLGEGILALATAPLSRMVNVPVSVFSMDQAGWGMVYMAVECVVFSLITLLVDHPGRQLRRQQLFFDRDAVPSPIEDEDVDVKRERAIVEQHNDPTRSADVVQVVHLRKVYPGGFNTPDKVAVQNLSFGVQKGEVFGFLGTNGAGKTTTMSVLTGEFLPSMGHATVDGFDVVADAASARRVIGYCPQFDALIDLLTPEEHLRLYASLRGVPTHLHQEVIEALLTACCLKPYRKIKSKSLSGGNKRKLSVAISLVGGPSVVFLDEPSAGMDPHARRQLWDVILHVAKRSSVVLTTHHLEEVDVLAHRVGIMVDGVMKCLGSLDYLKRRFGKGFEVAIKFQEENSATHAATIHSALVERIPHAQLTDTGRPGKVTYCIPVLQASMKLSEVFVALGELRDQSMAILDYTVQQTSLEQVFLRISEQEEDDVEGVTAVPQQGSQSKRMFLPD
jgi:ABC-type multidrug transport system ATPase subunit